MRIAVGCLLTMIGLLQACSSVSNSTRYYLLNSYQTVESIDELDRGIQRAAQEKIAVSVQLPEYLNQPSLVMQIDEHQIHYALFHVWAEPLLLGTTKALLADLNSQTETAEFVNARSLKWASPSSHLDVQIEYFHITNDSRVILSGQYRLDDGAHSQILLSGPFSFEQKLLADGYEPSIAQMRQLVSELAAELISRAKAVSP